MSSSVPSPTVGVREMDSRLHRAPATTQLPPQEEKQHQNRQIKKKSAGADRQSRGDKGIGWVEPCLLRSVIVELCPLIKDTVKTGRKAFLEQGVRWSLHRSRAKGIGNPGEK